MLCVPTHRIHTHIQHQTDPRKIVQAMDMSIILIVVTVSWMYVFVQTHQIVYIESVHILRISYTTMKLFFFSSMDVINLNVLDIERKGDLRGKNL